MSKSIGLALALFVFAAPITAQANAIDYNVSLIPVFGSTGGTGSFSVDGPIDPFFQNFTPGGGLLSLDLSIGGQTFSLSNGVSAGVTFLFGNFSSLDYHGAVVDLGKSLGFRL